MADDSDKTVAGIKKERGEDQRGTVESTEQQEDELAKTWDALSSNTRKMLRMVGNELCDLQKILQYCHGIDNAREKRKFSEVEKDVQVLVPKFAKLYRSIEDVEIKGYANLEAVALRAVALKIDTLHGELEDANNWYTSLTGGGNVKKST